MARNARKTSSSGYVHVITRGNGKQIIFEEPDDYRFYINRLEKFSKETGVSVCAYCLMENHVHLLLHDGNDALALFMKKLNVSYARFFNWKYERSGHLFQDRYSSKPVEDDPYFLWVLRYILNNPRKAGICDSGSYQWSSFGLFDGDSFVDTSFIKQLFASRRKYEEYILAPGDDDDPALEASRKDDRWAKEIIRRKMGLETGTAIAGFDREKRDEAISMLLHEGLSVRQIERLTGVSRYIVSKIAW